MVGVHGCEYEIRMRIRQVSFLEVTKCLGFSIRSRESDVCSSDRVLCGGKVRRCFSRSHHRCFKSSVCFGVWRGDAQSQNYKTNMFENQIVSDPSILEAIFQIMSFLFGLFSRAGETVSHARLGCLSLFCEAWKRRGALVSQMGSWDASSPNGWFPPSDGCFANTLPRCRARYWYLSVLCGWFKDASWCSHKDFGSVTFAERCLGTLVVWHGRWRVGFPSL